MPRTKRSKRRCAHGSRLAELRHLALLERSRNYAEQGKKSLARKDLERILAEDSTFDGVLEQLAELGGSAGTEFSSRLDAGSSP